MEGDRLAVGPDRLVRGGGRARLEVVVSGEQVGESEELDGPALLGGQRVEGVDAGAGRGVRQDVAQLGEQRTAVAAE